MTDTVSALAANHIPLHARIRELIREKALGGEIVDGDGRLMTEAQLGAYFGVSRVTIRNALMPLVDGGMFDRAPRRGTFLRTNSSERWVGRLLGFQEAVAEAGFEPGARILEKGAVGRPDRQVRAVMGAGPLWQLKRVRYADRTPIAIESAFYPSSIGAALAKRDLLAIRMYEVLETELGLPIRDADQTIAARLSSAAENVALELVEPTSLVSMTRSTYGEDGAVLEFLRAVYRPDFFQFSIKLNRTRL